MPKELEIKLTVTPSAQAKALEWLSSQPDAKVAGTKQLVNRYYDTPSADLNRSRIALRVRQVGDRYIQTLKTQGDYVEGVHHRQEWEWSVPNANLNLELIAGTPVASTIDLESLVPVFETNFSRQIVMIHDGQAEIECALDAGVVVAGHRRTPLHEIELELKGGDDRRLIHWARALAQVVPVFLNLVSKAEQGYWLANIYHPALPVAGDDAVRAFLSSLSIHWLTGDAGVAVATSLAGVRPLACKRGVGAQLDWLQHWAADKRPVDEWLSRPELGILQTRMVGAAETPD